jgi:hypothetical protein
LSFFRLGQYAIFSAYLLHQQPPTLKLIQLELDRSHLLCRIGIGSLDRPQHLTLAAKQDCGA